MIQLKLSRLSANLFNICPFLTQPCLLCGCYDAVEGLCQGCRADLIRLPDTQCVRCALPLAETGVCGRCQRHPPAWDALHVPYVFCYPLSALIHSLKYGKNLQIASILGKLMLENMPKISQRFDRIIPVPLSKQRFAGRGFNQSYELARSLAGIIPERLAPDLCWRKYNTRPQTGLSPRARRKNVHDAFCIQARVNGLSVAIIDDVVTTGATLDSLAVMMKKQGVKRVEIWALARAIPRNT